MARKTGLSRIQHGLFATPLEELIAPDNPVRVVDAFVNALDLDKIGFRAVRDNRMGASSYDPALLLKIYFYGYTNRIRSSRMLERECMRNVELMWLTECQTPSYHTISTFRTLKETDSDGNVTFNHRKALVQVFKVFNQFLDKLGLFGKQTFALDGTKIAAQNSKKRHISEDKIARKLERVENRIEEYFDELDKADLPGSDYDQLSENSKAILDAILDLEDRKEAIMKLDDLLQMAKAEDPHTTQVSLTDPDARMLPINNEGMMMVAYNVQSVVDDKHCLIADFSVENQKDLYLLAPRGIAVKEAFHIENDIELLADKGYHSAKGIHDCTEKGITTYVAFPEKTFRDRPKGFTKEDFEYHADKDVYTCPAKKELKTSGTWHEKHGRQGHQQPRYKLYRSPFSTCSECPFKDECCSKSNLQQRHGRTIERGEHDQAALENRRRILLHRDKYKRRQAIVEHPFGTIKRHWGFYFTLLKRKEKVAGEMAIVFASYNLRRAMSIFGVKDLILALKTRFFAKTTPSQHFRDVFFNPAKFRVPKFGAEKNELAKLGVAA